MATTKWLLNMNWGPPLSPHDLEFTFEDNGVWRNVYAQGLWVEIKHQPSGQKIRIFTNDDTTTKVHYTAIVSEDESNITGIMSHLPAGTGGYFSGAKIP